MKTANMEKQLILGMWPMISHLLSPKQHSIRFMHIPHIGMKRKLLTEAGRSDFQAVLGFLCCHVLHLPDVHTRIDAFTAYNVTVQGYTENLVNRCTFIIKRIIFCRDNL